jgi:hypothetical protein
MKKFQKADKPRVIMEFTKSFTRNDITFKSCETEIHFNGSCAGVFQSDFSTSMLFAPKEVLFGDVELSYKEFQEMIPKPAEMKNIFDGETLFFKFRKGIKNKGKTITEEEFKQLTGDLIVSVYVGQYFNKETEASGYFTTVRSIE